MATAGQSPPHPLCLEFTSEMIPTEAPVPPTPNSSFLWAFASVVLVHLEPSSRLTPPEKPLPGPHSPDHTVTQVSPASDQSQGEEDREGQPLIIYKVLQPPSPPLSFTATWRDPEGPTFLLERGRAGTRAQLPQIPMRTYLLHPQQRITHCWSYHLSCQQSACLC